MTIDYQASLSRGWWHGIGKSTKYHRINNGETLCGMEYTDDDLSFKQRPSPDQSCKKCLKK